MALLPFTKLGRDVFAPTNADGTARGADMGDAAVLTTEYEALLKALIADAGGIDLLPEIVFAQNSGAGTADAVKATATGELSTAPGAQLITVPFVATNTGPMTLSINGETPRPLVTNTGAAIPAGYVSAGMSALVQIDSDGAYRLFSYGDASAIQAAAEAAAAAAEDAADRAQSYAAMLSADRIKYPTVPALLADDTMSYDAGEDLVEVGDGDIIEAGGYRYEVAASGATDHHLETTGGVKLYVRPGEDGSVSIRQFGAVGDGSTSDDPAFIAASKAASAGDFNHLHLPPGEYVLSTSPEDGAYKAPLDINFAPKGFVLTGAGRDVTKIIQAPGSPARPCIIRNTDGVIVRGIHFLCTNTSAATMNFCLMNVNDHLVEECTFEAGTQYGLVISQDGLLEIDGTCNAEIVRNNIFKDVGCIGLEPFPKAISDWQMIYGNEFYRCGGNPNGYSSSIAAMKCGQSYKNSKVFNNLIIGHPTADAATGIAVGGFKTEVYNNTFRDVRGFAIPISLAAHSQYPDISGVLEHVHVHDNYIEYADDANNTYAAMVINGNITTNGPIVIEGNTFINPYEGIRVHPSVGFVLGKIRIRNNNFEGGRTADFLRLGINNDGVFDVDVEGNVFINTNLSAANARITVTKGENVRVRNNRLQNMGRIAINIDQPRGTHWIEDNIIDGYNVDGVGTLGAIHINDPSPENTHYIRGNSVLTGDGTPKSIISVTSSAPTYIVSGNISDAAIPLRSGSMTFGGYNTVPVAQMGGARHFFGTAAPSAGAFAQGDIVWNTAPTAGGTLCWVCTASGSPGTWKTVSIGT